MCSVSRKDHIFHNLNDCIFDDNIIFEQSNSCDNNKVFYMSNNIDRLFCYLNVSLPNVNIQNNITNESNETSVLVGIYVLIVNQENTAIFNGLKQLPIEKYRIPNDTPFWQYYIYLIPFKLFHSNTINNTKSLFSIWCIKNGLSNNRQLNISKL